MEKTRETAVRYCSFCDAKFSTEKCPSCRSTTHVKEIPAPARETCPTCNGTGVEERYSICRDCGDLPAPTREEVLEDYFSELVTRARLAAAKAAIKFPQPNFVTLKIAEEAGEVVRGAVHYAEKRMEWTEVEGEIVQLLAMLIRFVTEGDQVNGVIPPTVPEFNAPICDRGCPPWEIPCRIGCEHVRAIRDEVTTLRQKRDEAEREPVRWNMQAWRARATALEAENARLKDDLAKMTGLATSFLCDEIDYMLVNKLGDPEQQHNIRWARELGITVFSHAALTGDPAKPEGVSG